LNVQKGSIRIKWAKHRASVVLQAQHSILPVRRYATTVQLEDSNPISKPQNLIAVNAGPDVIKINVANQNANGAQQEDMVKCGDFLM
jgi:hypothetical protein